MAVHPGRGGVQSGGVAESEEQRQQRSAEGGLRRAGGQAAPGAPSKEGPLLRAQGGPRLIGPRVSWKEPEATCRLLRGQAEAALRLLLWHGLVELEKPEEESWSGRPQETRA